MVVQICALANIASGGARLANRWVRLWYWNHKSSNFFYNTEIDISLQRIARVAPGGGGGGAATGSVAVYFCKYFEKLYFFFHTEMNIRMLVILDLTLEEVDEHTKV